MKKTSIINIFRILYRVRIKFFIFLERYLSYLIPKKDNIWVYFPTHYRAIGGNIKAVFEYVNLHHQNIKQYILKDDISGKYIANEEDYKEYLVNRYSLKGIKFVLTAKVIFLDSGSYFHTGNFNVVQLWHGTGYKNIYSLSSKNRDNKKAYSKAKQKNIILIPATSEEDKLRKEKSFLTNNVYLTGSPRNDVLITSIQSSINKLRKKYQLDSFEKVICYAPTVRDDGNFNPFSETFYDKLQEIAIKNNFVFIFKNHPSQNNFVLPKNYSNILNFSKTIKDAHDILILSDVLITDYSGISSDFALLNKPMIFYTFDLEEYISNSRSFYYNIEQIFPGPFVLNETDLFSLIENTRWFYSEDYQSKFLKFQEMFHYYKDNQSSKRVVDLTIELLKNK
jgi:CDP-glycerol glycerophosphotransferase